MGPSPLASHPTGKLRLGHTLKRREDTTGWRLDLTRVRDSHKTSRFYGPFAAALPSELNGVLSASAALLEMEPGGTEAYIFHPVRSGTLDRPMESSAFSLYIKRLFKSLIGVEVAPKTLRCNPAPPDRLPDQPLSIRALFMQIDFHNMAAGEHGMSRDSEVRR